MRTRTKPQIQAHRARSRVLIVDDDADGLQALGVLFRRAGLSVSLAGSAREAARSVEQFRPNVLISDLAMPEEDGFALLRRVRKLERGLGRRSLAVAISAFSDPEMRGRAAAEGFEAYFVKPIDAEVVLSRLAQLGFEGKLGGGSGRGGSPALFSRSER